MLQLKKVILNIDNKAWFLHVSWTPIKKRCTEMNTARLNINRVLYQMGGQLITIDGASQQLTVAETTREILTMLQHAKPHSTHRLAVHPTLNISTSTFGVTLQPSYSLWCSPGRSGVGGGERGCTRPVATSTPGRDEDGGTDGNSRRTPVIRDRCLLERRSTRHSHAWPTTIGVRSIPSFLWYLTIPELCLILNICIASQVCIR